MSRTQKIILVVVVAVVVFIILIAIFAFQSSSSETHVSPQEPQGNAMIIIGGGERV